MGTCTFCQRPGELHEVEAPAIRLCTACREKMRTHIAVYCEGCEVLRWLPKSAGNVMFASQVSGKSPQEIMDGQILQSIKTCKGCYEAVKDFAVQAAWVQ